MSDGIVARQLLGLRIKKTVPATSTLTVDTIKTAKYKNLRYHIVVHAAGFTKSFDMSVINDGSSVKDSVFGRVGQLPASINALLSGTDTILEVTNPNAFDFEIELIRFKLGGN